MNDRYCYYKNFDVSHLNKYCLRGNIHRYRHYNVFVDIRIVRKICKDDINIEYNRYLKGGSNLKRNPHCSSTRSKTQDILFEYIYRSIVYFISIFFDFDFSPIIISSHWFSCNNTINFLEPTIRVHLCFVGVFDKYNPTPQWYII